MSKEELTFVLAALMEGKAMGIDWVSEGFYSYQCEVDNIEKAIAIVKKELGLQ